MAKRETVDSHGCHWRLEPALQKELAGSPDDWPVPPEQTPEHFVVGRRSVPRVRFGEEELGGDKQEFCSDCFARTQQLHAVGCDLEECPVCHRQVISCSCKIAEFGRIAND